MKKYAFIIFLFSSVACQSGSKDEKELLTAQAFADQLKSDPEITLIDVRTPEEFQSGFILGAVNMDFNSPDFQKSLDNLDRSGTYLLYCASGKRSGKAQQLMKDKGFERIQSMEGGMQFWVAAGLPVSKPN